MRKYFIQREITGVRLDNGDHILTDKIIFNGDFNDLDNYLINQRIRNKRLLIILGKSLIVGNNMDDEK